MAQIIATLIGLSLMFLIIRTALRGEKNLYFFQPKSPISEITPQYFLIHGEKVFWDDVAFIHWSTCYNRGYNKPVAKWISHDRNMLTLLIFTKNRKFPYLVNLMRFPKEEADKIITDFNRYNTRIDLWESKLQRWIWE